MRYYGYNFCPPNKVCEGKNVQNLAQFLATVDFHIATPERIESTERKSEKNLINYTLHPIPYWAEKLSTNKNLLTLVDPPKWTFFRENTFWPLGCAGPSNFYTRYWPGLASADTKRWRGSPRNFLGCPFKIWFKIQRVSAYNFENSGSNLTKLNYYATCLYNDVQGGRRDNWGTAVGRPKPPPQYMRGENVQNLARFLSTFDFDRKYFHNGPI